jgi:APA family basic amino acid/polyamine antiporter
MPDSAPAPLKRLLGAPTAMLLGLGVAIGSGIFRSPGEVAKNLAPIGLDQTGWIVLIWTIGGCVALTQGLVSAELATRFPKAGGEYVFLREAYGEFVAFFFGWAYTIFIVGGGAALIALAFGDFAVELLGLASEPLVATTQPISLSIAPGSLIAAGAIVVVIGVNAIGLRTGAGTQNVLSGAKVAALVALFVVCWTFSASPEVGVAAPSSASAPEEKTLFAALLGALLPALWAYDGTTDSVKMSEEVVDVRRAMPKALVTAAVLVAVLYIMVNVALLHVVPAEQMGGLSSVPGEALARLFGENGRRVALIGGMAVCLGSLSSTTLATVRVTFALARDGLAFTFLSRMSGSQAPVAALVVCGGFAIFLALLRDFSQVLGIYYFSAAILFGLVYASLIVFRRRERAFPETVFRCPAGIMLAAFLILLQTALAVNLAYHQRGDIAKTCVFLGFLAVCYGVLKLVRAQRGTESK